MPFDITDILDHYANDSGEWDDIYDEGDKDIRVLSGDVWETLDPAGAKQRKAAKRPMIAPDELGQYINQAVNDVRAHPRGIRYSPTGNGANDAGAEFYQNKMREIEYRSNAARAYSTAFENAIQRGYGYVRLNSKHVHDVLFDPDRPADVTLFEQELWIDAMPNPSMVLPDPYSLRPDLGDMQRCFVLEWQSRKDFKAKFPGAKIQNFTPNLVAKSRNWFTPDLKRLLTAEFWSIDRVKERTALVLKPERASRANPRPQERVVWLDELKEKPSSDLILKERKVPIGKVRQRITNGVEILETNDWDGKYIPITGCFGKILYVDDGQGAKKKVLSMTRLARDPFMAYAYLWSCETEVVGMTPKFPYFYYEGQLSPQMIEKLAESLHVPVAAIAVKAMVPGVTPPGMGALPFPQRNPYAGEALQYLELAKEAARRAIQSAMGITPLPTPTQRENQKSGKALQQIESSGQRGSYHFVDSFESMIRQVGVMAEDMMDKTYDTVRDVGVYKPDENAAIVRINDPEAKAPVMTKGDYQTTVSVGPATDSQREEASDFLETVVGQVETIAALSGKKAAAQVVGKSIRLKRLGPIGDSIADVIDPPQKDGQQLSPEAMAAMQENEQLKGALAEATKQIEMDTAKYQAQYQIETMKADKQAALQITLKQMDNAAKLEAAHITASKQGQTEEEHRTYEMIATGIEHAHEAHEAEKDRAHELETAQLAHEQAVAQGAQEAMNAPPPQAGA